MASNATVATVASFSRFASRQDRLKLLVGARPKPGASGQLGPKWLRRSAPYFHALSLLFLGFLLPGVTEQIINIGLGGQHFLHIVSGLAIL